MNMIISNTFKAINAANKYASSWLYMLIVSSWVRITLLLTVPEDSIFSSFEFDLPISRTNSRVLKNEILIYGNPVFRIPEYHILNNLILSNNDFQS